MRAVAMLRESIALALPADPFNRLRDLIEMPFQGRLQEGALVREILIQGSDRHAGPQRNPRRS